MNCIDHTMQQQLTHKRGELLYSVSVAGAAVHFSRFCLLWQAFAVLQQARRQGRTVFPKGKIHEGLPNFIMV